MPLPTLAFGLGGPFDLLIVLFILLLIAFPMIFWVVEIVDVVRRDFQDPNNKVVWLLVVIFLHFLGAAIYYFVGKRQGSLPGERRFV